MPLTTNRGYSVPATGSEPGIWGSSSLNPNFALIDNNLGGVATIALASSNVTLSAAQYQCGTIKFTGTLSANVTITFPGIGAWWTIDNRTTGDFYIFCTTGGGQGICPPPGEAIDVLCDGSEFRYRNLYVPIGGYWDYAGAAVPTWVSGCSTPPFLLCDGNFYSTITYPVLFTILGTAVLPDANGRARFALNRGSGRLTTVGGINGDTRFAAGGNGTGVQLTQANLPSVNFTVNGSSVYPVFGNVDLTNGPTTRSVNSGSETTRALGGVTAASGGSGTVIAAVPPGYVGGTTMIRSA